MGTRWVSVVRLSLSVLGVLGGSSGCRDRLTLPGDPIDVQTVTLTQPDAVQGETGIGVTLRLANTSTFRQSIEAVEFSISLGGNDHTSEYTITANSGNVTGMEPESVVDLAFTLTVSESAAAGSAAVNAIATSGSGTPGAPAPVAGPLQILLHAQLEVMSQTVDGATCRDSRVALLRAHVRNTGESTANLGAAIASILRDAADVTQEFVLSVSPSNPTSLAAGAEADLDVLIASDLLTAIGPVDASILAPASDARSAVDASAVAPPTGLDVHEPAALAVTNVAETRVTVSKGQTALVVTATLANSGSVPATIQSGAPTFAIGAGNNDADYTVTPPAFGVIAGGGSGGYDFTVAVTAGAASGATVIGAQFGALDAVCGESPSSSPAVMTGAWTVQTPPILVASIVNSTPQAWAGDSATVTLTVQNTGEAIANAVAPTIAIAGCPTCASLTAVDTGAKNIAGGASATYSWTAALSVPLPTGTDVGLPRFDLSGAGTDANTTGAVSSAPASSVSSVEARRPTSCFTFSPAATQVTGANPFSVDGSCSSDVETADAALLYSWDWTGDGIYDETGMTQTHDYTTPGKHVAVLRVTDADGRASITHHTLIVEDDAFIGCVTTTVDEQDVGATPGASGGVGFSLREAINWAASLPGRETVCFDPALAGQTITFTLGVLPILPIGGLRIAGGGVITIDFGTLSYGFRTRGNNELHGLRLTGVATGGVAKIVIGGNNVIVSECEIFAGGGAGIAWDQTLSSGPGNNLDVLDNDIHDNETDGIRIAPLSAGNIEVEILRNRIRDNGGSGIDASRIGTTNVVGRNLIHGNGSHGIVFGADSGDVINNTVAFNGGDGVRFVDCGCAPDHFFWNNLVFDNAGVGLNEVGDAGGDSNGKNFVFGNDLGGTLGNVNLVGSDQVNTLDPLLEADFELAPASPCRDNGVNAGGTPDANGRDAGTFYGTAFDVGAWESPR